MTMTLSAPLVPRLLVRGGGVRHGATPDEKRQDARPPTVVAAANGVPVGRRSSWRRSGIRRHPVCDDSLADRWSAGSSLGGESHQGKIRTAPAAGDLATFLRLVKKRRRESAIRNPAAYYVDAGFNPKEIEQ